MLGPRNARPATLKIFFDGGCRPNPGRMEIAVVARGIVHRRHDLGHGSSEQAEWLALIEALRVAQSLGASSVRILGDAASVIDQANGKARCRKPELSGLLAEFHERAGEFGSLRVRHIRRTQNLAGIALAAARQMSFAGASGLTVAKQQERIGERQPG